MLKVFAVGEDALGLKPMPSVSILEVVFVRLRDSPGMSSCTRLYIYPP